MKVTIEKGELLEVAIIEDDRVVGSLSLTLQDVAARAPKPVAKTPMGAAPKTTVKRHSGKRNVSPEARARMAEAQRRRWEAYRASKASEDQA